MYTIRLDHTSVSRKHVDAMSVIVGGEKVPMTRIGVNGNGDKLGETSEIIRTTASNEPEIQNDGSVNHEGQWETYEGTWVAESTETVFTFEAVESPSPIHGNLVDDISFEISYPLAYELNGGAGTVPNRR